jgi:hypothetical protein
MLHIWGVPVKVVTLRNLPPELARAIHRRARERGVSLSKTVVGLLEESMGLRGRRHANRLHHDLDALAGRWSSAEATAFGKAVAAQRRIDPDLWR